MNRKLIAMFLVLSMVITAFAGVISISAEEQAEKLLIEMLYGAQIRCAEPSGIRFISKVSKETAELAMQEGNEMGTYIFRYEDYKASGAKTPAEFLAMEGVKFAKIVAKDGIHEKKDGVYLYAALVNIKTTNYTRDFAAVSYVKLGDEISWSEFNAYDNVRNIREISIKAYNDYAYTENAVIDGYTYKYQVAEGVWSCYSPDQRKVIASYDNAIFRLMTDENGHVWNGANDKYGEPFLPALNSTEKHATVSKDVTISPLPSITDGALDFTYDEGYCGIYRTEFTSYNTDKSLTDFGKDLSDGFSFEVMFYPEALSAKRGDYRGIIDMVHAGGFGVNICGTDASASDEVMMRFECGSGTGYVEYKQALKVEQWYHMAVSYTGNGDDAKFTVYINGELVATLNAKGDLRMPDFRGEKYTADYLCIGGTYVASYDDRFFWQGVTDVKVKGFNLYSTSASEDEAIAMYETQELDKLLNTKHILRADKNGEFKVLVLSDVQHNNGDLSEETLNNIETIVKRENPDLVVFNGDNCFAIKSAEIMKTYITNMTKYLEDNKIPWAHVYGNHDHENGISKEVQQPIYESFEYCVSKAGDEELYGLGNYVLPVLSYDCSTILYNVWCLDSGAARGVYADFEGQHVRTDDGNYFYAHYDPMQQNQVDWYVETSTLLQKYNGGQTIPGMMAFHIPLQEMHTAWTLRNEEGANFTGEKRENISAHATDVPLFEAILERGDVKTIVNSHDHVNDFAVTYQGVRFAYTASIGTLEYHADEMLGGRVVQFSPKEETGMTTYMSYVQEREELSADSPILDLVIGNDNSVTNGIVGRPVLSSHDFEGSTKSIKTDATLDKKVLSFTGGGNHPSVYNLPISYLGSLFSDGFSYEIMFKVDDGVFNYSTKSYVGILDMEEAGGWGLNLYRGSTADKPVLYAEVAYASTWNSLKYTINTNEWYHCVYSYDGTNIALYINGVQVLTATVSGDYRAPSFTSDGSNPYICIGACAQSKTEGVSPTEKSTGMNGFAGDIAKVKIMPNPVTYEQARAMAKAEGMDKSNDPILDLVIGDDNSVTNGSFSRNELTSHDYTGSVKQVVTSAELARKVLSFSRSDGYLNGGASTYNLAAAGYNSLFADGFTLETMFKVDSALPAGLNVGIVDYVEAGGWGLIVTKASTDGKATLEVEFAHGTTAREWVEPTYEIDMDTWYHFVMVYDGNGNLTIYLNGVKNTAMSKTGLKPWWAPSFASRNGEEYICVGGMSAAWSDNTGDGANDRSTGINAFVGEIAKVKILPDAVTAAEARAMAQAEGMDDNNDPILDLVIDENGNVSNGSVFGPAISSTDVAGTEKVVDAENKTITFDGNLGASSDYKIPAKDIVADLADGFSFEVMFKVNVEAAHSANPAYKGILDYEQLGGFGFMVLDDGISNNGIVKVMFEFAYHDEAKSSNEWQKYSWKNVPYSNVKVSDAENDYWYHCVGSYDAKNNTISLYVNGEFVGSQTLPDRFHDTTFWHADPYISIGACADEQSDPKSQFSKIGFDGAISICRIYSKPVTAEQAAEMYQKAIA